MQAPMRFSFRDLYPELAGLATGERGTPELADRVALGVRAPQAGRRWITVLVLVGLLILFRYV